LEFCGVSVFVGWDFFGLIVGVSPGKI